MALKRCPGGGNMKRLIVCADGTWNSADSAKADGDGLTNVGRLRSAIAPRDPAGIEQRLEYHDGVGAKGSWWSRLVSGATGLGLSRNIKYLYKFLVENYQPGDELFFFGFSRGAFTVRSLSGLIRNCGILKKENAGRIDDAYDIYRDRSPDKHPDGKDSIAFRARYSNPDNKIKCVGVWDTVGALGIPTGGPLGLYTRRRYGFHDVRLSKWVENAFHALAIDEHRKPFAPTIWGVRDSDVSTPGRTQVVEQIWFPGVHSNVGGGYADTGLSNLAYRWVLKRANDCGLALNPGIAAGIKGDCLGKLYESMTWYYRLFGIYVRRVSEPMSDPDSKEKLHSFEWVAGDAFERRRTLRLPDHNPPYAPETLRPFAPAQESEVALGRT